MVMCASVRQAGPSGADTAATCTPTARPARAWWLIRSRAPPQLLGPVSVLASSPSSLLVQTRGVTDDSSSDGVPAALGDLDCVLGLLALAWPSPSCCRL